MSYSTVDYEWEKDDCTVVMEIGYDASPIVRATYTDPEEGGISLDYVTAKAIRWDDEPDRVATVEELSAAEIAFPDDKAWDIACEDASDREDNARESAAEARAERMAELKYGY